MLLAAVVATLASLIIIILGVPRLIKATRAYRDADETLTGMLLEIRNRLRQQDVRIVEQQVRIDVLEGRLVSSPKQREMIRPEENVGNQRDITLSTQVTPEGSSEHGILQSLINGARAARDVQTSIGRRVCF